MSAFHDERVLETLELTNDSLSTLRVALAKVVVGIEEMDKSLSKVNEQLEGIRQDFLYLQHVNAIIKRQNTWLLDDRAKLQQENTKLRQELTKAQESGTNGSANSRIAKEESIEDGRSANRDSSDIATEGEQVRGNFSLFT